VSRLSFDVEEQMRARDPEPETRARRAAGLEALLAPSSIAIIGASDDPSRVSGMPLAFLIAAGYEGGIYPVNPRRSKVQGRKSYPSIGDVPGTVDLAVIAVAAAHVVDVVEQCAAAGVRGVVIFSSGFAEAGPRGAERQAAIAEVVGRTGIRVCGPNCAGLMNVPSRVVASFGSHLAADTKLLPGRIAVVSQSGAVGAYLLTLARERGVGLSYWVTTGNEVDTQVADYIAAIAERRDTSVIALYVEQIRDANTLIEACELARRNGVRLVGIMPGRSTAAAEALLSHTAAIAGDHRVAVEALSEMGIAMVDSLDDLVSTSIALSSPTQPQIPGVGIVTISGAAGVMMVDRSADLGLPVPTLPATAQERMRELLPFAATANPIDVTGNITNTPDVFAPFLDEVLVCEEVGTVVCFLGHVIRSPHVGDRLVADVAAAAERADKPIWLVGVTPGLAQVAELERAGVPLFVDPVRAIEVLGVVLRARQSDALPGADGLAARRRLAAAHIAQLPAPGIRSLSERQAQSVFRQVGIRFPRQAVAADAAAAAQAVTQVGAPAVLKVLAPGLTHKTDVGGVRLGVTSAEAEEAFASIVEAVGRTAPGLQIEGVLVQETVEGHPVIVGARVDETFGPVVLVGTGGIYAELLNDQALALAPVDRDGAAALIERTKLPSFLRGARGGPPLAYEALLDVVVAVAELAWQTRDGIASLELNPVLVGLSEAVAVDAVVELKENHDGA
jgi:acyl-CoA synthetase (NDP forming)